ncbi:MAG: hypothetical protein IPK82_42765 [Polyangiaceae bacterium]|nr:hypothetical protein [Polyangiaceae bacterium]
MGNWKTGGEDDVDADGKYLLISVPQFKEDPISGKPMSSYIRLGAASSTWQQDPGGDLQAKVRWAGAPGGIGAAPGSEVAYTNDGAEDGRPVFVEDRRSRDGSPPPGQVAGGAREEESSHLHTRGGWRDHTDGNRITTTYGDKIEIIRGNYKLIVLGRQDDITQAAGRDISGQHIQDFAYTWPAFQRVEWTGEYGGVWHIQNTTDGAVTSDHFAGDKYEWNWGNKFQSITGSEAPVEMIAASDPLGRKPRGNPEIIEKTWAKRIESYTGSAAWRIPSIHEETWAVDMLSITDAASTTSTTTISGAITETTNAGTITDSTTSGAITSTTTSGAITETTTSGAITNTTTSGAITEITTAGRIGEVTIAGMKNEVLIAGLHTSTELAVKLDTFIGGTVEIDLGAKLSIALPEKTHTSFPNRTEQTLNEIKTSITALATSTEQRFFNTMFCVAALTVRLGAG